MVVHGPRAGSRAGGYAAVRLSEVRAISSVIAEFGLPLRHSRPWRSSRHGYFLRNSRHMCTVPCSAGPKSRERKFAWAIDGKADTITWPRSMLIWPVLQMLEHEKQPAKSSTSRGITLSRTLTILMAAVLIAGGTASHPRRASATPASGALKNEMPRGLESVEWTGRESRPRYYPPYYGYGFAATMMFGGMFAPPYILPGPYYYSNPDIDGPFSQDQVAYCMHRFKSYDRGSGTYLGRDGSRHPCP